MSRAARRPLPPRSRRDRRPARAVAAKLGVPRRTAAAHLDFLTRLGMPRTRRICCRTRYRRDETRIAEVLRVFENGW